MTTTADKIDPGKALPNLLRLAADTVHCDAAVTVPGVLLAEILREAASTYAELAERADGQELAQAAGMDPALLLANLIVDRTES